MSKIRVYIENVTDIVTISKIEIIHKLKNVLRINPYQNIYIFDGKGNEYIATVKKISKNLITLEDIKKIASQPYPEYEIILAFPLLREEKVDFILQKATELGVSYFFPFLSHHTLLKKISESKLKRWQKIILEATRQSNRLWLPKLSAVKEFSEILRTDADLKLLACIRGERIEKIFKNSNSYKKILVIVGPEGDFTDAEYKLLEENNFKRLLLSTNILRTETAAIFVVGLINYYLHYED